MLRTKQGWSEMFSLCACACYKFDSTHLACTKRTLFLDLTVTAPASQNHRNTKDTQSSTRFSSINSIQLILIHSEHHTTPHHTAMQMHHLHPISDLPTQKKARKRERGLKSPICNTRKTTRSPPNASSYPFHPNDSFLPRPR